jgi:hypothetical protein
MRRNKTKRSARTKMIFTATGGAEHEHWLGR